MPLTGLASIISLWEGWLTTGGVGMKRFIVVIPNGMEIEAAELRDLVSGKRPLLRGMEIFPKKNKVFV